MASATSPYVAQVRLKWGHGFIDPGEPVPTGTGRNYQLMLSQGEITFVGGGDGTVTRPKAGSLPHAGSQKREEVERYARSTAAHSDDLADLKRKELDDLAAREGVDDPDKLPNRDAVIEAIEAHRTAGE